MAFVKGIVEKTNARTLKFGTAIGLALGGKWYGFISKAGDVSKKYEGKFVTFDYEVDAKGYNQVDVNTLSIAEPEPGAASPPVFGGAVSVAKPAYVAATPKAPFNEKGVKVGHAINVAALLVANDKATDLKAAAKKILLLSKELEAEYDDIIATVPDKEVVREAVKAQPPVKAAAKAAKPAPVAELEDFDDDIPFGN